MCNRLLYREGCDYCATFGRIGNQLPYREMYDYIIVPLSVELISYSIGKSDYCAAFGSIGN